MKFIILALILSFSACSMREYKLFQHPNADHIESVQELNIEYQSKIIIDDIITIDIYNMNQKENIFMSSLIQQTKSNNSNEYIVSDEGTILLPLLSEVKVIGLTLKELNTLLSQKYKRFLNRPYVKSKIKNHRVYVLGETKTQGVVPIVGNNISIIELIAKVGGLSNEALGNKIRIISEKQGKYQLRTLDLTKFSTLNTHSLMVKHNSIVYIEPKSTKALKSNISAFSPIFRVISSTLNAFLAISLLKGQ